MVNNRATVTIPDGRAYWEETPPGEYRIRIEKFARTRTPGSRRKGPFMFHGSVVGSPDPKDIGFAVSLPFKRAKGVITLLSQLPITEAIFRKEEWIPLDILTGGVEHIMHPSLWNLLSVREDLERTFTLSPSHHWYPPRPLPQPGARCRRPVGLSQPHPGRWLPPTWLHHTHPCRPRHTPAPCGGHPCWGQCAPATHPGSPS